MNLSFDEGRLFYDLYAAILSFLNRKLNVAPEPFSNAAEYMSVSPEERLAIRDALFDKRELIDEFVAKNPAQLSAEQLRIVSTWKDVLPGKSYVFRYLKNHTVFLTSGISPAKAYGVVGLADPMEFVVGPSLPRLVTTVLCRFMERSSMTGWSQDTTSPLVVESSECLTRNTRKPKKLLASSLRLGLKPLR